MEGRSKIVTVRELRQNLSVFLRRVEAGETLAVTRRGKRVAILSPLGKPDVLDRLEAEGRLLPATERFEDLPPPIPYEVKPGERTATEELLAERDSYYEDDSRG